MKVLNKNPSPSMDMNAIINQYVYEQIEISVKSMVTSIKNPKISIF